MIKLGLFALLCCCGLLGFTQTDVELVKTVFPNAEYVTLNYHQKLTITLKDGKPYGETTVEQEYILLNEANASAFSHFAIYHSGFNELKNFEAYSKIPNGSKYKKIKIINEKTTSSSSSSVFYDDVKETSFDYAALVSGAVKYCNHTITHNDMHFANSFYVPTRIPLMEASFTVIAPKGFNLKFLVKNNDKNHLQADEIEEKGGNKIYRWRASKLKPIEDFSNAPDDRYFAPHIVPYIASFTQDGSPTSFLNDVNDLYKWNYSHLKDINKEDNNPILKTLLDSLVKGKITEKEKIASIYQWVQSNIKYVAFEAGLQGFVPRQAAEVCSKRYGDCKDMSSIITKLAQMANMKAYYTWIGTRSLPYRYEEVPTSIVDNHMISAAFIDNKWYFLDGTDANSTLDLPPSSIQGKEALLAISPTEYKILTVPTATAQTNVIDDSTFIQITNQGIKGTQHVTYTGYFGSDFYTTLLYRNEKETRDYIKSRTGKASNKFMLSDFKINRINPEEKKLFLDAQFEIPGVGKKIANEFYLNLNLEKLMENAVIDTANRIIPVEIDYKYEIKQSHILDIPAEYKLQYLPPNFTIDNNLFAYTITYKQINNQVIATQFKQSKTLSIAPSDFQEWNDACKKIAQHYKEQIVLEKK